MVKARVLRRIAIAMPNGDFRTGENELEAEVPPGGDAFQIQKDLEMDVNMALAEFEEKHKSSPSQPETSKPIAQVPGPPPPLPPGYQPATAYPVPSKPPESAAPQPKPPTGTSLEKVKLALKPYEGLLEFRELPKTILIFPREWIGSNVWAEINDLVLSFPEGLWIGKEKVQDPKTVHWEIPK